MLAPAGSIKIVDAWIADATDLTLPNTAGVWAELLRLDGITKFEIPIAAKVGDKVSIATHGMRNQASSTAYVDVGVMVGSSIERFMASGTSTPGSEGDPGWYPQNTFSLNSGPRGFQVTANDLDSGFVRFAMVVKAGGAGVFYASTNYPFYWRAENYGSNS